MRYVQLALYDKPQGQLLADWSAEITRLTWSTGQHGFAELQAEVALAQLDALRWLRWVGTPHIEVNSHAGQALYEGRLEDIALTTKGLSLTAFGYWNALKDVPQTALWSDSTLVSWRAAHKTDYPANIPSVNKNPYLMDADTALFIGLKRGMVYANNGDIGAWEYPWPRTSSRLLSGISFSYSINLPANWLVRIVAYTNENWTGATFLETITATGTLQTGTRSYTYSGKKITIYIYNATGNAYTCATNDGEWYVRLTTLRVTTAPITTPEAIIKDLVTQTNTINPLQISASAAQIQSMGTDLKDIAYDSMYPADLIDQLVNQGDSNGNEWEAMIYGGQNLIVRPRGTGRAWMVDLAELHLERSLEQLWNSAYTVYETVNGAAVQTASATDTRSQNVYGLIRRRAIDLQTTDSTAALARRTTAINATKDLYPRATFRFDRLYDMNGACWPLYSIRAGDALTIRNVTMIGAGTINATDTFWVAATTYNPIANTIEVEPEAAMPALHTLLAELVRR